MVWKVGVSLQSITVIAGIESLIIIKALSDRKVLSVEVYTAIVSTFAANYALLFFYSTFVYPNIFSPLRHIPRGKWWLLRKLNQQLVRRSTSAEALYRIAQETPNDGLVALRESSGLTLLVTEPHVMADLLVHNASDFSKPETVRTLLGYLAGNGLLVLEGDEHGFMRKKSLPHFSFRSVKNLYPLMWNHSLSFADALETELVQQSAGYQNGSALSGKVEFSHWANRTTVNIISTTVFGDDFKAHNDGKYRAIVELLRIFLEPDVNMQLYISLAVVFSFRFVKAIPWRMNRVFQGTSAALIEMCVQLVGDKRQAIKKDGQSVDILSNIIKSNDFSDKEIAAQLLTYMLAGNDTTAISMSWACYLLAIDQARQSTLRREVREVLLPNGVSGKGSKVDLADILEHLPLLNGIISETLRLYPAVPVTYRTSIRDSTLGEVPIPKGTHIYVSPWIFNRSRKSWGPAADTFQPERWISHEGDDNGRQRIDPTGGARSNYAFLTFLQGRRSCIGQGFARAELRCLLAVMAMLFEWSLDMDEKDVTMGGAITIKPQHGLHLRLKRIEGS